MPSPANESSRWRWLDRAGVPRRLFLCWPEGFSLHCRSRSGKVNARFPPCFLKFFIGLCEVNRPAFVSSCFPGTVRVRTETSTPLAWLRAGLIIMIRRDVTNQSSRRGFGDRPVTRDALQRRLLGGNPCSRRRRPRRHHASPTPAAPDAGTSGVTAKRSWVLSPPQLGDLAGSLNLFIKIAVGRRGVPPGVFWPGPGGSGGPPPAPAMRVANRGAAARPLRGPARRPP